MNFNRKSLSPDVSRKFRTVSGFSMMAVVLIHAKFILSRWSEWMDTGTAVGRLSELLQFSVSETVCRLAVPLFFVISGFFMAWGNDGSLTTYIGKIRKRVRTLLVPYCAFSVFWLLPTMAMSKVHISSLTDLFSYIFITPVPFQFWFLQHLMLLCLLSWLLMAALRRSAAIVLVVELVLYFVFGDWASSLMFYTLGLWWASVYEILRLSRLIYIYLAVYVVLAAAGIVIYECCGLTPMYYIVHKAGVVYGVVTAIGWIVFPTVPRQLPVIPAGMCFFVYAMHEPLQSFVKSAAVSHVSSQAALLVCYLLIPLCTIAVCICIYKLLGIICPKLLLVFTGGR